MHSGVPPYPDVALSSAGLPHALGCLTRRAIFRMPSYPTRLLGTVEAGFPSPAEEELCDTLSLDEYLISNREATYLLRVKGDSMIEAGILEGDMVLVERTNDAKVGDIVIAEVDGEWTMKYLRKGQDGYYLQAANPKYPLIVPSGDLKIAAVVTCVIRKVR